MSNYRRWRVEGGTYFFTVVTHGRQPFLINDNATRWRQIKSTFTRSYRPFMTTQEHLPASRRRRNEQAVWQRRFYEHTCRDESDLKRRIDYTHVNPVKHKLVDRVRDWPWSSFHRYVQLGEYENGWGDGQWFGDEFQWAE